MKIELKEITVRELTEGYKDDAENGVVGYGGKLDIRPPYQREFIYKDKQRDAVIDTITKDYPLNVMYWAVRDDGNFEIIDGKCTNDRQKIQVEEGGSFEVIDGQQRTISVCQYVNDDFAFKNLFFSNLQKDQREQILNYKLMVYFCEGTDSEKLEWFKTINIAGEKLTDQELRNAVYHGSWVSDAKRYFSKNQCVAYKIGKDYLNGSPIRQEYLETAIDWISGGKIESYMSKNQHEPNANELWLYFQSVINWVKAVFPNYRKEMKGLPWGLFFNEYKNQKFDSQKLEQEIADLMQDEDVTSKKGIYEYVLTKKEKHLNIRAFADSQKRETYERQQGICTNCNKHFNLSEMEADHIKPWHEGGKTTAENCQMLCKDCNRRKSGK
jgi:hypothetical protein